jgi:pimeloyl-ACP methyl ester carboxylesterase
VRLLCLARRSRRPSLSIGQGGRGAHAESRHLTFRTWDGLELAYQVWGPESSLPPVLLHHGFVADADSNWVAVGVVARLLEAGRLVVAHDARGHGRSEKPHDAARYGEQRMARDLGALVEEIGAEQIDLVGYSMGAVVSLLFASSCATVRRMVIGGVGAGVVECGGVDRRQVSNDSIIAALEAEDVAAAKDLAPGGLAFRRLADALGSDRLALLAQASSVYQDGVALENIAAPTLLLAGDEDPLAVRPQVLVDELPDGHLTILSGNHMSALADPRFASSIVDFLAVEL